MIQRERKTVAKCNLTGKKQWESVALPKWLVDKSIWVGQAHGEHKNTSVKSKSGT